MASSWIGQEKVVYRLHHLCLDKGYDYAEVIEGVKERDYHLHLAKSQAERAKRPGEKSIRPGDGSSNEPMLGIIGSVVC